MKYFIVIVVLSSLLIVGCEENNLNGPVAISSTETQVSLAKPKDKSACPEELRYGGKTYHGVEIGAQCWLKENLDVGTMIPGSQNASDNDVIEKYCYNDDPANCETYGGLYQWTEAMKYKTEAGSRGICPNGWHIPTLSDCEVLSATVSADANALKAVGQGLDDGAGTNASGFSALLGGFHGSLNGFGLLTNNGAFPSSSLTLQGGGTYVSTLNLYDRVGVVLLGYEYLNSGLSVRCVRD